MFLNILQNSFRPVQNYPESQLKCSTIALQMYKPIETLSNEQTERY